MEGRRAERSLAQMKTNLANARQQGDSHSLGRLFGWNPPDWMYDSNDPLVLQFEAIHDLMQNGEVTWAGLIIANDIMFQPGRELGAPGSVVYSFDSFAQRVPEFLSFVAGNMQTIRESRLTAALPMRAVAEVMADDYGRAFGMRVPPTLSLRRVANFSSIYFPRTALPGGYLENGLFPIVTKRGIGTPAQVLPYPLWDEEMMKFWQSRRPPA